MQPLIWESRPDTLRAPALVCAFTGWNDAGDAASAALQFARSPPGAGRFARPAPPRAPALVCAFTGWNDAGDAASAALQFVGSSLGAVRFARIDPEEFFDFQATRPKVRLLDGRTRSIEWPDVEIYAARVPRAPRDLVLLQGPEPSFRWKGFCRQILDLGDALGVQLVV